MFDQHCSARLDRGNVLALHDDYTTEGGMRSCNTVSAQACKSKRLDVESTAVDKLVLYKHLVEASLELPHVPAASAVKGRVRADDDVSTGATTLFHAVNSTCSIIQNSQPSTWDDCKLNLHGLLTEV